MTSFLTIHHIKLRKHHLHKIYAQYKSIKSMCLLLLNIKNKDHIFSHFLKVPLFDKPWVTQPSKLGQDIYDGLRVQESEHCRWTYISAYLSKNSARNASRPFRNNGASNQNQCLTGTFI